MPEGRSGLLRVVRLSADSAGVQFIFWECEPMNRGKLHLAARLLGGPKCSDQASVAAGPAVAVPAVALLAARAWR
eukprot:2540444-Pyramimonas_sp.AAC.1